jgi:hypothetical protein
MEEKQEGSGSKKIYLGIIALLLLINGVAGYLLFNENKAKETKIAEVQKKDTEIKDLNQQFENAKQELESMKGKNAALDSVVTARQAAIEKVQGELVAAQKRGNMSAAEVQKYKAIIAKMEGENADLQKKVQELTAKNEELTTKNLEVTKNLEAEKTTTAALSEEKKNLSHKVELGQLLQPQNITVVGEHKRKNGKEKAMKSAKKVDYIKITFATGDNKVLEKGPLTLYVRIINPKGETIAVADQGSGSIKLADGNQEVQYSKKVDLDWDQSSKNVTIEWSQNIKDPGAYSVELYQSGYLIGKGKVDLK